MSDELMSCCREVEQKLDFWVREADFLIACCWHSDEPAVCHVSDGWTYARVLHAFKDRFPDCVVFRHPHSDCWLVFQMRRDFLRYVRFLNKHKYIFA